MAYRYSKVTFEIAGINI